MVQILWKSRAPHSPRQDHDLVELRLVDLGNATALRYLVREVRASWSASAQKIEWQGYIDLAFDSPQKARRSFESRKASMAEAGYQYTTVLA